MNSRLCGCSFIRPGETIAQGLARVRRLGFTHVDIGVGGGNAHFLPEVVASTPDLFAEMVIREAGRLGVQPNECFLLNFGWPINSPDAERRQRTHELFPGVCRFASAIGCKSILVIPGPVLTDQSKERSLELSAGALQNLAAIAGDFSLHLNAEADIDSCASTPEAAEELCKRVPGLGLTLDYSHFVCQGIEPARIERLHRFTRHLHVRQAAPGQIATEIDDGVIDFSAVLRQLESTGYSGLYCVEYLALTPGEDAGCCAEQRTLDARYQLEHYFREGSNEN